MDIFKSILFKSKKSWGKEKKKNTLKIVTGYKVQEKYQLNAMWVLGYNPE